jgi:8-oxo-dGTP pyrophosphatase MutT (NUDIX family)
MGQRHASHRFMPNQYVFPGGRVDRADSSVRVGTTLREEAVGGGYVTDAEFDEVVRPEKMISPG